jgi:predicted SprT family Zn-dependent metalloprotease
MNSIIDTKEDIDFLNIMLEQNNTKEKKIKFLELTERQKYNYYCDCSQNFTQEQDNAYHEVWNWIINKLKELKAL